MQPAKQVDSFHGRVILTGEFSGLRLLEGIYAAKTRVPLHAHREAVFCMDLTGTCDEVFGGRLRQYDADTAVFLPAHQSHSLHFPSADTRAFSIDVADSWIERAREFSLRPEQSVHARDGALGALMRAIHGEFRQRDSASPVAIQSLTMELLAAVSRMHALRTDRQPPPSLARAEDFLRAGFADRLALAEVAAAAGVHPVYLARMFRRHNGCTIGEYLRRLRVERARCLLRSSPESLATIAAASGFADQSHFCRTFKRLTGMTPARYRAVANAH